MLISPYIRPHTTSTVFYNHYSWLRTIEDLFSVGRAFKGLDGQGHIGYAAQRGLAPFGADVFNHPKGQPTPAIRQIRPYPWLAAEVDLVYTPDPHREHPASSARDPRRYRRSHRRGGRVLATAVGPTVPHPGRVPIPTTSPCTFTVRFTARSGVMPLGATAFTLVDEFGHVHHPRVTTLGGGPPPRQLFAGRPMSLTIRAVLPTGNGSLAVGPERPRPIVAWDFNIEVD